VAATRMALLARGVLVLLLTTPCDVAALSLGIPAAATPCGVAALSLGLSAAAPPRSRRPRCSLALGDTVRVVADVKVEGGLNANGLLGEVVSKHDEESEATLSVCLRRKPVTAYLAYDEVAMVEKCGPRTDENAYERFVEGDRVRVVTDDVLVRGESVEGRLGVVSSAWSQCETDPACCCNELATDAPLQVQLDEPEATLIGYFNDEEVELIAPKS